jgi:hypothetical protein
MIRSNILKHNASKKEIQQLIIREKRRTTYRKLGQLFNPVVTKGLSRIDIPVYFRRSKRSKNLEGALADCDATRENSRSCEDNESTTIPPSTSGLAI